MKRGIFVSIEGIDGSGKSSCIPHIVERLQNSGQKVITTREPGGTELAESIRSLILNKDMDPIAEVLLAFAARRDHICKVIKPALDSGFCVVSDRFCDSSFAYQGAGRGIDLGFIEVLEQKVQATSGQYPTLQPDLTLFFDVDPAVAAARISGSRTLDRFEAQNTEFFKSVRNGYLQRFSKSAAMHPQRIISFISAKQSQEEVVGDVLQALQEYEDAGFMEVQAPKE